MRQRLKRRLTQTWFVFAFCLSLMLAGVVVANQAMPAPDAYAGAEIVGNPDGAADRLIVQSNDRVRRIIYVQAGVHTSPGANTPVASNPYCDQAGLFHYAEVQLTGTLTGTNPTLAVLWQNSKDGGTTWTNVGTWTTVNATVTPATQSQTVSDIAASTAVVYGDCWRVTYTFTGTGNPSGNFKILGMEK